jgi:type I restriction enzyme, S subunit
MTTDGNGKRPLPDGWKWTTIKDVAEINYGKGLPKRERNENGKIPVYGSNGITGYHSESLVDGPCLIIGRKGAAGVVHYSPTACWPIDTTYYAHFGENISLRYAYYALKTLDLEQLDRSTAIPSLSRDDLFVQSFPLAPLPVQERIVAEIEKQFTRLDTAVSTLNRLQSNLDRYQASLLKAACTGQLLLQDPNDEPAERLLQRILAERRQRWLETEWQNQIERAQKKAAQAQRQAAGRPHHIRDLDPADWQSIPEAEYAPYLPQNDKWQKKYKEPAAVETADLPDLPSGWVWANIGYLFDVKVGSTPSRRKEKYWNGDIPWVSSGEVAFAHIKETEETITKAGLDNSSVQLNPPGTVLLAMIGEGKTRGQAAILDVAATNNQNACAILCADSVIPSEWVFYWLMARYEETRSGGSGGMQPALNSQLVKALLIPVAPLNEMRQIVEEIESKLSIVTATQQAISANLTRSGRLRQSILQQAFNGRLV